MTEPLRVISLGWGVQSFALAAMSALGELPPVDAAIHADTTHERSETYAFAARWTPWLEERGVRVVTVKPYRRAEDAVSASGELMSPAYSAWPNGNPSGMLRRQCTSDWKIMPIRRWVREHRAGRRTEMLLGITLDEWTRMRTSDVQYIAHRYPFMDFAQPWRRGKAMQWLQDNGLEIPVKSGCVFCPYHDHATWREIKTGSNGDWQKAIDIDRLIRHKRNGYVCYLHRSLQPLDQVDLRNEQDHGQLELWGEECTGNCFL